MSVFRLGELFCGPGGLARGALDAAIELPDFKIRHEWSTDYDPDACTTYRHNICPERPETVLCEDIRSLRFDGLPEIDGLAFGFPCNDFSTLGEYKGIDGSFGQLYKYSLNALRHFHPHWFVAENVTGLKSANDGRAIKSILGEMKEEGYRLYPHMYRFEEYGIPQMRHRILIVGIRSDLRVEFKIPSPKGYQERSCRMALEDPPISADAPNNEPIRHSPAVVARLRHIGVGENAFTANLPEELRLNVSGATMSQIYRRLDPDRPAYTVTGSGGGGTYLYHWEENRALTNRERARLQTFQDDYVFFGNKMSIRRQIGMAVPPAGARIIFEALLRSLAGIPYDSVPPNVELPMETYQLQLPI